MKLGYNTNGLAHHDPIDAIDLLVATGYRSVAITIDHYLLNPYANHASGQLDALKQSLARSGMSSVIESGARFLLDPRQKHAPTLLDDDSDQVQRRIDFLKHCIDIAVQLDSDCVSIWSGAKPQDQNFNESLDRLAKNLRVVLNYAEENSVDIGFEPEPGMLIDTTGRFERLLHLVDSPRLKMTLDLGHLFCLNEVPMVDYIQRWRDRIVNVHIEDMVAGVHEHLMFGEGQIYFPPVLEALAGIGYRGGLHVELSRHSHDAARAVEQSYRFLKPIVDDALASSVPEQEK